MNFLAFQFREPAVVDKILLATFSFENPLDVRLTDVEIFFEGAGLRRPVRIKLGYVR